MQQLIQPINKCRLTASYKNPSYSKKYGFVHYGADMISIQGNTTVYASGNGVVTNVGTDSVVGKIVVIKYPAAYNHLSQSYHDIIARYYHLDNIKISAGNTVTKDTVIGNYGNTGMLVMGKHLHIVRP